MPGPTPKILAMVVCDEIIQDRRSGKFSLIGIFDHFRTPVVPVHLRPIGVYARLVDAQGDYTFKLDLVRVKDLQTIGSVSGLQALIRDRLQVYELALGLPMLRFDEFGPYEFRLFADDQHVGSSPFSVVQISPERSSP